MRAAALDERWKDRPNGIQGAEQIRFDDCSPALRIASRGRALIRYAGVCDQYVYASKPFASNRRELLEGPCVTHVNGEGQSLPADACDLVKHPIHTGRVRSRLEQGSHPHGRMPLQSQLRSHLQAPR